MVTADALETYLTPADIAKILQLHPSRRCDGADAAFFWPMDQTAAGERIRPVRVSHCGVGDRCVLAGHCRRSSRQSALRQDSP